MKIAEVKELSDKEIIERIEGEKEKLSQLKLNHAISPLDNPNQIKEVRKTIARLNTEVSAREAKQN
ncbi:MAG: 50S ribosomal protein L29 [Paludibacteraceae bacterium]|nr:50S ribosomal protein L29 [Paludibacteraceae bacterium]MBP6283989.1 50S ribosomal protein L29 [Paludibacteraceae bacterium]